MNCKRKGCRREAVGDEFCSTFCAKVYFGILTQHDLYVSRTTKEQSRTLIEDGPVYMDNPHRNLDRHEGPQIRQKRGLRG